MITNRDEIAAIMRESDLEPWDTDRVEGEYWHAVQPGRTRDGRAFSIYYQVRIGEEEVDDDQWYLDHVSCIEMEEGEA